jgi:hypothetical protein
VGLICIYGHGELEVVEAQLLAEFLFRAPVMA